MAKRLVHHVHSTIHLVGLSGGSSHAEWVPNTDIFETEGSICVRLEVAGVSREDVQITLADRSLVIRGKRPDHCRNEPCQFRQMEIHYGVFERRIVIPKNIDPKKVKASYRNGFLLIDLPKMTKSNPVRMKVDIEED